MKKVLVGMFIALMGVFMVSCSNGGGIEKAKEIINELKADGAKLDKEGLKAKMMEFAEALKPEMTKMTNLMEEVKKEIEKDPSKAAEIMEKSEEKAKEFQELETIMDDMTTLSKELPAMKELETDDEFQKKFQEALGFPVAL